MFFFCVWRWGWSVTALVWCGFSAGVISNARYSAGLSLDKADTVAVTLAVSSAYTGDLDYQNKLYAQLEKLSATDLVGFARRWLVESNRVTVTLAAKKEAGK